MEDSIIHWLLSKRNSIQLGSIDSLAQWKNILKERFAEWEFTIDRAIAFGFAADRVSYAFIAGFRAALQYLIPNLEAHVFASFCITEESGNTPKAINSTLKASDESENQWVLNGKKTFITGATESDQIFVAASIGKDDEGRNRIKLVRLDSRLPGIDIQEMPPLPFIPEISHGEVSFTDVRLSRESILPGDGYSEYVKPFRIVEEIHVTAALLGYLARVGMEYKWDRTHLEEVVALIKLARALWHSDLQASGTHIAYAGFSRLMQQFIEKTSANWEMVPDITRKSWERDKAILGIAEKARKKRLENAWQAVSAIEKISD